MTADIVPYELWDGDEEGDILAVRADRPGDTRGKAQAYLANERGLDFIDIDVRRMWFRPDEYATEDYPVRACGPRDPGAVPFWGIV